MAFDRSRRKPGGVFAAFVACVPLAIAVATGGGCNDSSGPAPAAPATTGDVTIAFDHEVNGAPLTLNSTRYQNAAGNDYNVADLRYYISDIQLVRSDAAVAAGPEVFYRDAAVEATHNLVITVPSGDYVALRFTFGVNAAHNHPNGLSNAIENLNMQWPDVFGGGYHYMQLDGHYATAAGDVGWLAHLGRLQRDTDPAPLDPGFHVELPLTLHVANDASTVHVVMDVNAWFATPSLYDFNNVGPDEMSDPVALQALHDNGAHAFQNDLGPAPDPVLISAPGFPALVVPANNPTSRQGVELGRRLFYDTILSGDSTMSCASCHAPEFAFTDHGRTVSRGIQGLEGRRNAPSLTNIGWNRAQFWEGRRQTLEEQAGDPVPAHNEMDLPWAVAVQRLQRSPVYPALFRAAFRTSVISRSRAVEAIAQFERTFVSVNSPYDRFLQGTGTLTPNERHGYVLFFTEKADCFHCHVNITFTDFGFQNNGLDSIFVDPGRSAVSFDDNDIGKFKTPTLRNVEFTAPYMHDGRFATLEEVLDHYDSHARSTPTVNPFIRVNGRTLGLSAQDKQDVIAFLKTLTDSSFVNNPSLRSPF